MVSINRKVMLWAFLLASSYFCLFFSVTSNVLLSLSSSLLIFFFTYVTMRELAETITGLNARLTDYEALNLLATTLLSSLDSRRNLLSFLEGAYRSPDNRSQALLKMKNVVRKSLHQRIFKCKRLNNQETRLSSPLTRLLFSLIGKLDFIDESSLKDFFISLHKLSFSLYLNAKKLKDLIVVEKVKYKVLQVASSMTLGFVIKTLSVFMKFSSSNISFSLFTFISFATLSITLFIVFPSIIHLRFPSFKDLAVCIFIFLTFMILPPYGGV